MNRWPGIKSSYSALLVSLVLCVSPLLATTYYVDANHGDDEAAGTSEWQAWRSLRRVQIAPLQPGDKILLRRGAIWRESLDLRNSGILGKVINISAYGTGPKPVITANDLLGRWDRVGQNVWRTPVLWTPLQVSRNGAPVARNDSVNRFTSLGYALAEGWLYVFSSGDPKSDGSRWEASRRLYAVNIENASFLRVENLDLRSNNSNGYAVLRIAASKSVSAISIVGTEVSQGSSSCVYVKTDPGGAIADLSFSDLFAHHCALVSSSTGGLIFGANGGRATRNVSIVHSRVAYNGVDGETSAQPLPALGIDLANVQQGLLQDTEADHNGSSGINIQKGSTHIVIKGGSSHDNGLAARGDRNGIAIGGYGNGSSQIRIEDMDIYNNTSANIEIDSTDTDKVSSEVTIVASRIHDANGSGIQIGGGHHGIAIIGNSVQNNGRYGIALFAGRSGVPKVAINDNIILRNGESDRRTTDLFLGSAKVVLKNNTVPANNVRH